MKPAGIGFVLWSGGYKIFLLINQLCLPGVSALTYAADHAITYCRLRRTKPRRAPWISINVFGSIFERFQPSSVVDYTPQLTCHITSQASQLSPPGNVP